MLQLIVATLLILIYIMLLLVWYIVDRITFLRWIVRWLLIAVLSAILVCLAFNPAIASPYPPAFRVGNDVYLMGFDQYAGQLVPALHEFSDIRRNIRANRCGVVRVQALDELKLFSDSRVRVNNSLYGTLALSTLPQLSTIPACRQDGTTDLTEPAISLSGDRWRGHDLVRTLAIPGFAPRERVEVRYIRNFQAWHRVNDCGFIHDDSDGPDWNNSYTIFRDQFGSGSSTYVDVDTLPRQRHAPLCINGVFYNPNPVN